eukprot:gene27957-8839_t
MLPPGILVLGTPHPAPNHVLLPVLPMQEIQLTMTTSAEIEAAPYLGSLFWKLQVTVFVGNIPDNYAVLPGDSTMAIVQEHAAWVQGRNNAAAPREGCLDPCWVAYQVFGDVEGDSSEPIRRCANMPEQCAAAAAASGDGGTGVRGSPVQNSSTSLLPDMCESAQPANATASTTKSIGGSTNSTVVDPPGGGGPSVPANKNRRALGEEGGPSPSSAQSACTAVERGLLMRQMANLSRPAGTAVPLKAQVAPVCLDERPYPSGLHVMVVDGASSSAELSSQLSGELRSPPGADETQAPLRGMLSIPGLGAGDQTRAARRGLHPIPGQRTGDQTQALHRKLLQAEANQSPTGPVDNEPTGHENVLATTVYYSEDMCCSPDDGAFPGLGCTP